MTIKKLVGTAPSQVPRNRDLGTMAYQDTSIIKGPTFSAYVSSQQTITSGGVQQKVLFATEEFDTNDCFTSSRFTPNIPGFYFIDSTVRLDGDTGTGEAMVVIWKNGSEAKRGWNSSGTQWASSFFAMSVSGLVYCNGSTDYIEIYLQHGAGSSRTTTVGANISYFQGFLARPA